MVSTRSSDANEMAPSDVQTKTASGAMKKGPSSKVPANARERRKNGHGRFPQEHAYEATSSADEAVILNTPQDAGVPVEAADPMVLVEGALVNGNVVASVAEPADSQDGAGAPTSQRLIIKVGRGRGKAKESSASTPGTSATTSGARTGVSTPASDASTGTKRKHNEIEGDPDIIDSYQRMIKELLGVMVR